MMRRIMRGTAAAALVAVLGTTAVGCSSGKPSKGEFRDAMVTNAKSAGFLTENGGDELDCMADESYDDLSDEMLRATVEEDSDHEPSEADRKVIADASKLCADRAMGADAEPLAP
ncbi:hypothetical protein [Nocardioides jishulii]|uniref:DUF732 domain-containing protein n=1 Tax=Nocardioides jishulii TaxID=2575440 RepID=A0A4U2YHE3_9ACTN|nr:hypothetical protein [Nocardioides jishulii]QCX26576.1 hypothetical protein FCL41_02715 [Nocardioides jishulii]TKI60456.1 hypothetical protein FC770_16835 [Nocardioides jishulii]